MATERAEQRRQRPDEKGADGMDMQMYVRFAAMLLTGMVVMYLVMFVASWDPSHVRLSQSRIFMALTMGGAMGLVMLAWMLNMYRSRVGNAIVIAVSLALLAMGTSLDRSQATVDDTAFMKAMIPHHSLAITRSERFNAEDIRVCALAREISEAQRREILEMHWLINDIARHGPASTAAEADRRPAPTFREPADRTCETK